MPFDAELSAVAERFVGFVQREAGCPVIVCDERAVIAHATVKARVGQTHPGARTILSGDAEEVLVTAEMEAADPRMRQGCNSPIRVGGRVVGTFGVAGPVEVARPLAHVAAGVLAGWIREVAQRKRLAAAADEVVSRVASLTERVESAASQSRAIEERMASASADAASRAARTGEVLASVQKVAAQSRILAINGSVEASRAGDAGRAFAVVAREMLALAEDAKASAGRIQEALGAVGAALARHAGALEASGRAGREQLDAMGGLAALVAGLRDRIAGLAASFDDAGAAAPRGEAAAPPDAAFWDVAGRFLAFVAQEAGRPGVVCDADGVIVRAGDRTRVGKSHAGAVRILREALDEAAVTAEEAARNPDVREGCSCPIVADGRRIGTFGVTGPLALTRPLARVASSVLATRVREHGSRRLLGAAAAEVFGGVDGLSARTRATAEQAARLAAEMAGAAREVEERLAAIDALAGGVQQLSQQSRIIAVNGSVEAANAAAGATAFANVARDMLRLADDTSRAGKEIGEALRAIRGAIQALAAAAALQDQAGRARAEAAQAVLASAAGLRGTLETLLASFDRDEGASSPRPRPAAAATPSSRSRP
jgi:methyl-accepting chemotaxis protein